MKHENTTPRIPHGESEVLWQYLWPRLCGSIFDRAGVTVCFGLTPSTVVFAIPVSLSFAGRALPTSTTAERQRSAAAAATAVDETPAEIIAVKRAVVAVAAVAVAAATLTAATLTAEALA